MVMTLLSHFMTLFSSLFSYYWYMLENLMSISFCLSSGSLRVARQAWCQLTSMTYGKINSKSLFHTVHLKSWHQYVVDPTLMAATAVSTPAAGPGGHQPAIPMGGAHGHGSFGSESSQGQQPLHWWIYRRRGGREDERKKKMKDILVHKF